MMSLLGLETEYNILKNANGELILSADYGANMQVYCSVYSTSGSIYGSVLSEKDYETFLSASMVTPVLMVLHLEICIIQTAAG